MYLSCTSTRTVLIRHRRCCTNTGNLPQVVVALQQPKLQQQQQQQQRWNSSSNRSGGSINDSWQYNRNEYNDDKYSNKYDNWSRPKKRVLVLGSSGIVGTAITKQLSQYANCSITGIDIVSPPPFNPNHTSRKWKLDNFIQLSTTDISDLSNLTTKLITSVHDLVVTHQQSSTSSEQQYRRPIPDYETYEHDDDDYNDIEPDNGFGFDAIICASGGWIPDPNPPPIPTLRSSVSTSTTNDDDEQIKRMIFNTGIDYSQSIQQMLTVNLYPVLAAGYVSQQYMNRNGLFIAIGATVALGPTPDMIAYGISKAAVHHAITSIGAITGNSIVSKSLRSTGRSIRTKTISYVTSGQISNESSYDTMSVIGILPTTLDTPANRKQSTNTNNTSTVLTPPDDIAQQISTWITMPTLRPHSGSLIKVVTKKVSPVASQPLSLSLSSKQSSLSSSSSSNTKQSDVVTTFELVR